MSTGSASERYVGARLASDLRACEVTEDRHLRKSCVPVTAKGVSADDGELDVRLRED